MWENQCKSNWPFLHFSVGFSLNATWDSRNGVIWWKHWGYFPREICSSHHPPTANSMLTQALWILLRGYSIGKGRGVTYHKQRQAKLHLESEHLVPITAAILICSFKSSIENRVVPWFKVNIWDSCSHLCSSKHSFDSIWNFWSYSISRD